MDVGGFGGYGKELIEGEAGVEGVHLGEGGDFSFVGGVEPAEVGLGAEVEEHPGLGLYFCFGLHNNRSEK